MAACIICGVLVAALLIPTTSSPLHFSVNPVVNTAVDTANQSLQRTLTEFQNEDVSTQIRHSAVTPPRTARQSASPATVAEILHTPPRRAIPSSQANYIETTSIDRAVTQSGGRGQSMPQFYAPVTVHPVTVNIDNSGIILELARVSERLDSLARTPIPVEPVRPSIHVMDIQQSSTPIPYQVHRKDDEARKSPRSKSDSDPGHTETRKSARQPERIPTANFYPPRLSEEFVSPPLSSRSKTSVAPIPIAADERSAIADPASVADPIRTADPVLVPVEPRVIESKRQPFEEFPAKLIPLQSVPEVLPQAIPDATIEDLRPIECTEEFFSVPEPVGSAALRPEVSRSPASSTVVETDQEVPIQISPIPAEQTQIPEFNWSLEPNRQGAKRTTDPPFMNGRRLPVPIPAERFAKATQTGGIQQASYTTLAARAPVSTAANCQCTPARKSEMYFGPQEKSPVPSQQPKSSPSKPNASKPNTSKSTASRMMEKVGKLFGR